MLFIYVNQSDLATEIDVIKPSNKYIFCQQMPKLAKHIWNNFKSATHIKGIGNHVWS